MFALSVFSCPSMNCNYHITKTGTKRIFFCKTIFIFWGLRDTIIQARGYQRVRAGSKSNQIKIVWTTKCLMRMILVIINPCIHVHCSQRVFNKPRGRPRRKWLESVSSTMEGTTKKDHRMSSLRKKEKRA